MTIQCETVVATCIDFRFQESFDAWCQQNLRYGDYDRIAIAGGVKNWQTVFSQIKIAKDLHGVKKVVLVNHENCGAYGENGTRERHESHLRAARDSLLEEFPDVEVELYYARLAGGFEAVE